MPETKCQHQNVQIEDDVVHCIDCGHAVENSRPRNILSELASAVAREIADELAEKLDAPEDWVDVERTARHLCCKPQRIYDLCSRSGLPHTKEGTRSLFKLSELDAWLERRNAA
jgi:hypothetical protein